MESTLTDTQTLVAKLDKHPWIKDRIASMLEVVENAQGDMKRADDAEARMIEEVCRLGQQALQAWAEHQVEQTEQHRAQGHEDHLAQIMPLRGARARVRQRRKGFNQGHLHSRQNRK